MKGGWEGVPVYNTPISGAFIESLKTGNNKPFYYLQNLALKDCDFGAVIAGDGMHGEILHGDFIICREVINKDFIIFGEIYYVITDELEACSYLDKGNGDNDLILVPHNKSVRSIPVNRADIKHVYKVKGIVRGY